MKLRHPALWWAVVAAGITLAMRVEAWLIVAAIVATAHVYIRSRIRQRLRWSPWTIALLALLGDEPEGGSDAHLPRADAALLAAEARGDIAVLDRASSLIRDEDTDHWPDAIERIETARALVDTIGTGGMAGSIRRLGWRLAAWTAITVATTIALGSGQGGQHVVLVFLIGLVATTATLTDLRDRRATRPPLVAASAVALKGRPTLRGCGRQPSVLAAMAGSPPVLDRAIEEVERWHLDPGPRQGAVAVLRTARQLVPSNATRRTPTALLPPATGLVAAAVVWIVTA